MFNNEIPELNLDIQGCCSIDELPYVHEKGAFVRGG